MTVKKVYIVPGCISCGTCEQICPDVFEVKNIAQVKDGAPLEKNTELIKEAADICPVSVIKYEE
jgi:ferredoxin